METEIDTKEKVKVKYEDAVASGKTSVMGTFSNDRSRDLIRISIGIFPPESEATLKLFYYQNLELEDLSYCLRVPMSYIPRYMGDIAKYITTGLSFKG